MHIAVAQRLPVAAGAILLHHHMEGQQSVVKNMAEDLVQIWAKLEATHLQKRPCTRFKCYDNPFSIRKQEDKYLTALMTRVDAAVQQVNFVPYQRTSGPSLHPSCSFPNSIIPLLGMLAFWRSRNCQPRPSDAPIALNTANIAQISKSLFSCTFCNATGHVVDTCFKFCDMQRQVQQRDLKLHKAGCSKGKKKSDQANQAEEETEKVTLAGNASAFIPIIPSYLCAFC
jgi:hypothetical protein